MGHSIIDRMAHRHFHWSARSLPTHNRNRLPCHKTRCVRQSAHDLGQPVAIRPSGHVISDSANRDHWAQKTRHTTFAAIKSVVIDSFTYATDPYKLGPIATRPTMGDHRRCGQRPMIEHPRSNNDRSKALSTGSSALWRSSALWDRAPCRMERTSTRAMRTFGGDALGYAVF